MSYLLRPRARTVGLARQRDSGSSTRPEVASAAGSIPAGVAEIGKAIRVAWGYLRAAIVYTGVYISVVYSRILRAKPGTGGRGQAPVIRLTQSLTQSRDTSRGNCPTIGTPNCTVSGTVVPLPGQVSHKWVSLLDQLDRLEALGADISTVVLAPEVSIGSYQYQGYKPPRPDTEYQERINTLRRLSTEGNLYTALDSLYGVQGTTRE